MAKFSAVKNSYYSNKNSGCGGLFTTTKTRPRFQICLRGKGWNDSKSADYVEVKVEQLEKYVAVGNVLD